MQNEGRATKEFVEKYYTDDLADRDTPESRWAKQWTKEVRGEHVLDIGCGPQFFDDALDFAELPKEVVGVDLNEANIEFLQQSQHPRVVHAKAALAARGVGTTFFVHDITTERSEFVGRFDAVYASGVLGMFDEEETRHILSLIATYLKPGGRFVMVSWGDDRLSPEKFQERNGYNWYWRKGPGPDALAHILAELGFTVERKEVYTVPDPEEYEWGIIYGLVATKK